MSSSKRSVPKGELPVHHISKRALINLIIVGLALYVVVPATGGLSRGTEALRLANPSFVLLAVLCIMASYAIAAVTYRLLAIQSIAYLPTLYIQIAGGFVNRLLPAGLGGIGLNAIYLMKHRHSTAAATAVVTTNNFVGFIGNAVLVTVGLVLVPSAIPDVSLPKFSGQAIVVALLLSAVCFGFIALRHSWYTLARKFSGQTLKYIAQYSHHARRFIFAILSSMILTALHSTALYLIAGSINIDISAVQALIVVTIGVFAGAALPTPGGIGGAEAGLIATLAAYGIDPSAALAVVLVYRGITFWAPLLPGFLMLQVVEKKYLGQ